MVCNNLDIDLIRIDLINEFGISYDARTQQVFSISDISDTWQVTGETTISTFSTVVTTVRFMGDNIIPFTTPVAAITSPRHRHLTGDQPWYHWTTIKSAKWELPTQLPVPSIWEEKDLLSDHGKKPYKHQYLLLC